MTHILRFLTASLTVFMLAFAAPAGAEDLKPGTPWREVDGQLQKILLALVQKQGLKDLPPDAQPLGLAKKKGDTSGCPSNCNDDYYGGMCRCTEDDKGNCPEGSSNPGTGKECTAKKESYSLIYGGRPEPLRIVGVNDF